MAIKISGAYKLIDFICHYQNGFFLWFKCRIEIGYDKKKHISQVYISQYIMIMTTALHLVRQSISKQNYKLD